MPHILMVTHWTSGDVIPFIKLGSFLKKNNYDVTFATHCAYEESIKKNGMEFVAIDSHEQNQNLMNELSSMMDPLKEKKDFLNFFQKYQGNGRLSTETNTLLPYCREDTVILYRHVSSISGLLAAECKGLAAFPVFLAPNYLAHFDIQEMAIGKEIAEIINAERNILGLQPIRSRASWMMSPKKKICAWPEWFSDEEIIKKKDFFHLGFSTEKDVLEDGETEVAIEFAKKNPGTVLVTGGTSKTIDLDFFNVAVSGCGVVNKPVIAIIPYDEYIPKVKHENILFVKRVKLMDVLPYVDKIINHGGIGTAIESLLCHKPQLILPQFADRPDNAHRLHRVGVAEFLPKSRWSAENVVNKLEALNSDEVRRNCKNYAQMVVDDDSMKKLISLLELAVSDEAYHYYVEENFSFKNNKDCKKEVNAKQRYLSEVIRRKLKDRQH